MNAKDNPFRKKKDRIQILGLNRESILKYFFGGNASLAIVILSLICVFLAKEAIGFFPSHHRGLQLYRLSGQEFVDYLKRESSKHKKVAGYLAKAYYGEINASSQREQALLVAYEDISERLKRETSRETLLFNTAFENLLDLRFEIEEAEIEQEAIEDFDLEAAKIDVEQLSQQLEERRQALRSRKTEALNSAQYRALDAPVSLSDTDYQRLAEAIILTDPDAEEDAPHIEDLNRTVDEKKAAAEAQYQTLFAHLEAFQAAGRPLDQLVDKLRDHARSTKERAVAAETLRKGKAALLVGAENAKDPHRRAEFLSDAEAIEVEDLPYQELNQIFYDHIEEHQGVTSQMSRELQDIGEQLETTGETPIAQKNLTRFHEELPKLITMLGETSERLRAWQHDEPFPFFRSILAFFLGKDWVTNSSWHDFYGILPLFTGSILISLIALTVTVPFSVGAAIYVNQIAGWREQNAIKPVIEFIQAIPSIVLGFFGIAVLGTTLREVSQIEWLSWVPGFPMQERLNILNAGLLLAFMAIPTVFTLAEDALNNVPRSFTEGSLALGATKLQTILRIVVPGALSGIIAAILLGFGRIIGETMVVLLVAGGSISIPDFAEGIGVITQPVHTMTGIIAQETGEVDQGSIHYRALFMLGMVLFSISLLINYTAQKIVLKYQLAR